MEQNNALTTQDFQELDLVNEVPRQPIASFDMSTEEGQNKAIKCVASADYSLTNYLDTPIVISDFFVHPVKIKNDGEVRTGARLVIIDENGSTYATSSMSIANALSQFYYIKQGNIKGLAVKVKTVSTRGGFKAYTLVPA